LHVVEGLISRQAPALVVVTIDRGPVILINRLGVVRNDDQGVCPMGSTHFLLWTVLEDPCPFSVGIFITGRELFLKRQFDPSLAFQRTEHLLEQNRNQQVGQH
jgi:hypothetical protein